jgi:ABC-type glycerol-3-phosphate transport system substrate-binding protein
MAGGVTRRAYLGGVVVGASGALAGCGAAGLAPGPQPAELAGTFDLLMQPGTWLQAVEQQARTLHEQHPGAQVNIVQGGSSAQLFEKIRTTTAAGTPPDGFWHYSFSWRGVDAATVMLPLTPTFFRRAELERVTFPSMLDAVWARNSREVFFVPWLVGLNAAMLLYNTSHLADQGLDPKGLTTLDAVAAAAARLVVREGGTLTRAGLHLAWPENLLQNWILDQGAAFYDERARRWTWQTLAAERALQWMVDAAERAGVAWRPAQAPAAATNQLAQGYAAMRAGAGAYELSGIVLNFRDIAAADAPMPPFVAGRQPHYYVPGVAGFSLAAALKPDSAKARIGAALYRLMLSPEAALLVASTYSGAILVKDLYASPGFKETPFGANRADFASQVLGRTVMLNLVTSDSTTQPDFLAHVGKVLNGEVPVKAARGHPAGVRRARGRGLAEPGAGHPVVAGGRRRSMALRGAGTGAGRDPAAPTAARSARPASAPATGRGTGAAARGVGARSGEAGAQGEGGGGGAGGDAQLGVDVGQVPPHGGLGHHERGRDLPVGFAGGHVAQHLRLPGGEAPGAPAARGRARWPLRDAGGRCGRRQRHPGLGDGFAG